MKVRFDNLAEDSDGMRWDEMEAAIDFGEDGWRGVGV